MQAQELEMTCDEIRGKLATTTEELQAQEDTASAALQDLQLLNDALKNRHTALYKEKERFCARSSRAVEMRKQAVENASARQSTPVYSLKDSYGIVTDTARSFVQDLVSRGIANEKIFDTMVSSALHLGVEIDGEISSRTVSRIALEGGLVAKLKVANELENATGMIYDLIMELHVTDAAVEFL